MAAFYNNPISINDAINNTFSSLGLEKDYLKARVMSEWEEIIGKKLAHKITIDGYDDDILYLRTESSVWRNEIAIRRKEIIEKINARFNIQVFKEIHIR
jgi:predicted nucleic acid-binding Zn ribbon protein